MKRLGLFLGLCVLLLSACGPTVRIENSVLPTLVSVTVPQTADGMIVLQGRYFGNGTSEQDEDSYVIVGSDINGGSGYRVYANSWTPSRIELAVPEGAGFGYVFVVVNGVRSNGLPANLP